jgi:hypothetical protein
LYNAIELHSFLELHKTRETYFNANNEVLEAGLELLCRRIVTGFVGKCSVGCDNASGEQQRDYHTLPPCDKHNRLETKEFG